MGGHTGTIERIIDADLEKANVKGKRYKIFLNSGNLRIPAANMFPMRNTAKSQIQHAGIAVIYGARLSYIATVPYAFFTYFKI